MTIVVSGGAKGSDYLWSSLAIDNGLKVEIMSFKGHYISTPIGSSVKVLSVKDLDEMYEQLVNVSKTLKRDIPKTIYTRNLLLRNIHIVKDVDAVFAISYLYDSIVSGGTAWGCHYHLSYHQKPQLFLFDMKTNNWLTNVKGEWISATPPNVMEFSKVALIGSRELTTEAKIAMKNIF